METIEKISHHLSEGVVSFFNTPATKQENGEWEFVKEVSHKLRNKTIDELYRDFEEKILSISPERILETKSILCNEAYAVALYTKGIITKEMISSIEERVGGSGRGMTPLIVMKNCEVFLGTTTVRIKVFVVTLNSYHSFVLIDNNDNDM